MRRWMLAAALAATVPVGLATPAIAQSAADQARWDDAQARYQAEYDRYMAERQRYIGARRAWRRGDDLPVPPPPPGPGYGAPPPPGPGYGAGAPPPPPPGGYNDDRYDPNYDAADYYRQGGQYQERVLANNDRVYRGSDGQYYCKRSDGTTGLIVGGAAGGVLGNVIDGGHSRTAGTLIGAALGALAGKAVDQNQSQIKCR